MGVSMTIALAVLSGILNGSYAVPERYIKIWKWENTWLSFALSGLLLIPWFFAVNFIRDIGGIFAIASVKTIAVVFLFGLGWGIGAIAFVKALRLIGFSLGYTLMMGLIAVIGAMVPLLIQGTSILNTQRGRIILLSLLATIIGIIFCGHAGKSREMKSKEKSDDSLAKKSNFKKGLILCFISGVFSAMLNFSFEFGSPLNDLALEKLEPGANSFKASSIIWSVALTGGFLAFFVYTLYLFIKNKTFQNFSVKKTNKCFFLTFIMGIIFYGSVLCYGWSASALGSAGTTIGWVIFTAGAIVTANIWGLLYSEWKGVPRKALNKMVFGTVLLIGAVALISYGNSLL